MFCRLVFHVIASVILALAFYHEKQIQRARVGYFDVWSLGILVGANIIIVLIVTNKRPPSLPKHKMLRDGLLGCVPSHGHLYVVRRNFFIDMITGLAIVALGVHEERVLYVVVLCMMLMFVILAITHLRRKNRFFYALLSLTIVIMCIHNAMKDGLVLYKYRV